MAAKVVATLAGIVFLRVAGVSLLIAGFIAHAESLGGGVQAAGIAFGAYPLALALFLYPLAALSDRVGRRPVLVAGLVVSALGGVLAAFAPTVGLLALGRFVQGAGAINGVALAVAGEIGEPDRRARRMAALGASAGAGFAAGLVAGALLEPWLGVPGLLLAHSLFSLLLVPAVLAGVPGGRPLRAPPGLPRPRARAKLAALALGAFAVNFSLTGLVFLSPLLVTGAPYALVVTLMVLPAGAGIFVAARLSDAGHARAVGVASAATLGLAPLAFILGVPLWPLVLAGVAYFLGHSALSAQMPALAAEHAPETRRGAAQGAQSTLQYLGSATGSIVVAALYPSAPLLAAAFVGAGALAGGAVALAAR